MMVQDRAHRLIATDLYELTMAKGYLDGRMENKLATFELFIRSLPEDWGFLVANGIEDAIDFLVEDFFFRPDEIEYLRYKGFPEYFLEFIKYIRFCGDVWSVPEGTIVPPNIPIIRVTAPLIQAQLAETAILNIVNFQTLIATKANRIVRSAAGAPVVDFGLRRAQGLEAGLKGARAAFIGGCGGTSNVEAGKRYGIPLSGTQAHSWVMVFQTEIEAFRAYVASFHENVTLLIDTYDVLEGAKNASIVAKEMEAAGHRLSAVRIDSGNLADLSMKVRAILDGEGLCYVKIIGTGDLNEYKISELVAKGARIDAYGVGTELITGKPVSALPGVYKLAQIEDRPVIKLSDDKITYPGMKQVYRLTDDHGNYKGDFLALDIEMAQDILDSEAKNWISSKDLNAIPLLCQVVSKGRSILSKRSIRETQSYVEGCVSRLPNESLRINAPTPYAARPTSRLIQLMKDLIENMKNNRL